jgi:hypothetical protein
MAKNNCNKIVFTPFLQFVGEKCQIYIVMIIHKIDPRSQE